MEQNALILEVASKLDTCGGRLPIIVGFDGFVDDIIHVVDEREDTENYSRIPTIEAMAERISKLAGLSGNLELVTLKSKLGGNGPIMANALIRQGHPCTYIGTIGEGEIHPLFQDFAADCERVISMCEPAYTQALEFSDGKLMFGKMGGISKLNWDLISAEVDTGELRGKAGLVAFTNWTMLPGMNSIISGFTDLMRGSDWTPHVFFDLADPSKRTDRDILGLFDLVRDMAPHARVIFGMNENESRIIARLLHVDEADLGIRASRIREALGVSVAVIHPTIGAAAADENGSWWVDGPYTAKPRLTTGAGDNFNAGFCHGILCGLTPRESLVSGVSTSGFYVRNERSPEGGELAGFMRDWVAGRV